MSWYDGIEGNALEIARTDESPLRVMAGPGTGKSFAMKRRVARILEEEDVDPARILAVTFTRTAARDLKEELHQLEIEGCENIDAGTLHSFCFRLLSKNHVLEYLGREPQPLLTIPQSGILKFQAEPMLYDLQRKGDFGALREMTKRIRAYEAAWARLQIDEPGRIQNQADLEFEEALIKWLTFHKGMLIGELVPYALRYIQDNPMCDERRSYDYVIIDEYQDLNKAEQVLIDLISENSNTSIVGDIDQSIYSFKHAHPEGILEYSQTHEGTHDEELTECRRCPSSVVTIADNLIRNNHSDRTQPRLVPHIDNSEGEVEILQFRTIEEETEALAELINHLIDNEGYGPEDILVLTPRRVIAYQIRDNLYGMDVPVHSYYQEEALEETEAQLAFAKLSLLVNREDRLALRFWLGFGSSTWHRYPYSYLRSYCQENGVSPYNVLVQLANQEINIPYSNVLEKKFIEIRSELERLESLTVQEVIDTLFPLGEDWAEQLRSLANGVIHNGITLKKLLSELTIKITQPVMPEDGNYVRIMSLHKSKGLSSPVVIIAGCVEGLIPITDSNLVGLEQERALQEQRRLFYVAMTRTRERLIMCNFREIARSFAYKIGAKIHGNTTITSRFIRELGPDAPDVQDGDQWRRNGFS